MTQLLLSVRDAAEARTALAAGAALIDCKEPHAGALGRPEPSAVEAILDEVAGRVPVSLACGELRDLITPSPPHLVTPSLSYPPTLHYAKLGLAGPHTLRDWPRRWHAWADALPAQVAPVAVIYADARAGAPPPETILGLAFTTRCAAVLIDTYDKSRGGLWRHVTPPRLARWLAAIRERGLMSVVGGSLALRDIPSFAGLAPDYLAFRSAACRPNRAGRLDLDAANALNEAVAALAARLQDKMHAALRT